MGPGFGISNKQMLQRYWPTSSLWVARPRWPSLYLRRLGWGDSTRIGHWAVRGASQTHLCLRVGRGDGWLHSHGARALSHLKAPRHPAHLQLVFSRPAASSCLQPHRLQPARLLRPWDSPGKSTGLGCHSPGGLPDPGLKPVSPAPQAASLTPSQRQI